VTLRVLAHYAIAETRRSRGTLLFCVLSIALGVLSLTGVRSIIVGLEAGLDRQAKSIAGADLQIEASQPLTDPTSEALTLELRAAGAEVASVTAFYSMLYRTDDAGTVAAPRTTRLVRVRALGDGYPFYGRIATQPADRRARLGAEPALIVEPLVLRELGLQVGDRVRLGDAELRVIGEQLREPGSPAAGFSLAPAVFMHERYLEQTGLLRTGSRVSYVRAFKTPPGFDVEAWKQASWDRALDSNLSLRTADESAASVQRFLERLSYFLTIVGLITLLLGALGIGSAMNVFIRGKLDNAAVFRCLGARPRDVFAIYCAVALLVGAIGSAIGVALGSAAPFAVALVADRLGADLLPAQIEFGFSWLAVAHGLAAGITATCVFALLPVHRIRAVSPLRVMRRAADALPTPRGPRELGVYAAALGLLFAFILALAIVETDSTRVAIYFTAAVAGALALLAAVARLAMAGARRLLPRVRRYHLRQGIANLYRPGNQTTAVITAVGVGILLVGSIFIIEASLQRTLDIEDRDELPNVFAIDIQPEQRAQVEAILADAGAKDVVIAPMVAARIAGVNGRAVDRSQVERNAVRRSWQDRMRTREYFISYRDAAVANEELVAGRLWRGRPERQEASIDVSLARNLGVELGDTLTLDVQGIPVDTTVTSFREIRWQAMRPNAMILLSPGPIEDAPKMFVSSFRLADETVRYRVQERLVRGFPNLSVIDISETAATVRMLLERISLILSFLALLTIAAGAIILGGAIAAGRFARQRESMLLKVLGASRRDLRRILVSEYAALALLGGASGWLLAELINRPALTLFFDAPPTVPYPAIAGLLAAVIVLNVGVGLVISRGVSNGRPLDVLREE
jgi:putative ABC transport system permease protein